MTRTEVRKISMLLFLLVISACATTANRPKPAKTATAVKPTSEQTTLLEIESESVEFPSGEITLKATLLRPTRVGIWPGVVILGDWGVRGRDGVVGEVFGVRLPGEVAVYRTLAEALASRGFAVLIYDKRNCSEGTAPWCSYPAAWATARTDFGTALVDDALAAARWLKSRDDVHSLAMIGHGHGAEVAIVAAPEVAASAAVLLAAPGASLEDRAAFEIGESIRLIDARIAEVGDVPEADLLKGTRRELEQRQAATPNVLGAAPITATDLQQLHDRYETVAQARRQRVLLIGAEIDPGAPPQSRTYVEELFGAATVVIPGLTRAMVQVGLNDDPTVVSSAVIDQIISFLRSPQKP